VDGIAAKKRRRRITGRPSALQLVKVVPLREDFVRGMFVRRIGRRDFRFVPPAPVLPKDETTGRKMEARKFLILMFLPPSF
jgi:hypothetical protein